MALTLEDEMLLVNLILVGVTLNPVLTGIQKDFLGFTWDWCC